MKIKNGLVFDLENGFVARELCTDGMYIAENSADDVEIDAADCYVIPGLVDVHFHGAVGEDFSDATAEGLQKIINDEGTAAGLAKILAGIIPALAKLPELIKSI